MITLNGTQFAANHTEMVNSLFVAGSTPVGFYKANKKTVTLFNLQHQKIGVINQHGVLCEASKQNGKWWYTLATIPAIGEYASYMQSVNEPEAILKNLTAQ